MYKKIPTGKFTPLCIFKTLFVIFTLFLINFSVQAQCPCSCGSCTWTVSTTVSTNYTVGAGQTLCITATGNVTGSITLNAGGTVCNSGSITPSGISFFTGGTLNNCGTITGSFSIYMDDDDEFLYNCSGGTITLNGGGGVTLNGGGYFKNEGLITLNGGGSFLDQGGDMFINDGTITINNGGDFTANGSNNGFCNNGTINMTGVGSRFLGNGSGSSNHGTINTYDFDLNGDDFYNACTINVLHDFFANGGSMTGPTTAGQYGRYNISGSSGYNGCDIGIGGSRIDICDAGMPAGGWDLKNGGSIGANVTYCVNAATCSGTGSCTIPCTLPTPSVAGTSTICPGGSTTLTADGGTSYSWNTGATTSSISVSPGSTTTYTVTVTNSCGNATKTQRVTVNAAPAPGITGSNSICNGASTTLTGTGGGTYSWNTGATTTTINVSPGSTTTYTVTVTNTSGCTATTIKVLTVNSNPSPGISGTSTVCNGTSTTLTGSGGSGYSWSPGGATTTAITVSPGSNTTYSVVVTNASGCTARATQAVTVNANPSPGISGTTTICNGKSTTLTATGGGTYSWNTGETTAPITISPGANTTYTVTVTNGSGCTATMASAVTVNPTPTAGITGTTTICDGTSTTLTGTGGGTYSWNTGDATTAITVSPNTTTTYTVTVTNGSGCTATTAQAVTVNALPTASIGSTPATCGTSNGTATVTASGSGVLTYSWSPSGQTTPVATGLSSGSYTVRITDGNGCTIDASVSVNNATGPTASFVSQTDVLCTGAATGSATVTGSGGTGTLTYSWSPGGQTTTTITDLSAGTYICTVTDANGCAQGQSVTISEPAAPISSGISSQTNVGCTGAATGSITITASGGTGAYTYNWSPGGSTNATVNGLTIGSYSVTITDANGCTKEQTVIITQPASALNSTISSQSDVGCTGAATGSVTVTGIGGTPVYTYNWSTGETTASVSGLSVGTYSVTITDANGCTKEQIVTITQPASALNSTISSQSDVGCTGAATGSATVTGIGGTPVYTYNWSTGATTASVSGLPVGTYSVTLTDANGCTKEQVVTITQPAAALSSTITSQNNVGCTGAATGSATVTGVGGTPVYTYNWSTGETTASVNGLTMGVYSVTITDANGCTAVQSVIITQPASAIISGILSQSDVRCTGNSTGDATISAVGGTPGYTYNWTPSGGTDATAINLSAGTYNVTITDNNGCTKVQTVIIAEPSAPIGSAINSQIDVGCTGNATGSAQVTGTGGTPNYTYDWLPQGTSGPNASGLTAGTYTVIITDQNGCSTNQTITITQPASAISTTTSSTDATCGNSNGTATVTAIGGTPVPGYIYNWSPAGGTNSTATGLSAGAYVVIVTDGNGCTSSANVAVNNAGSPDVAVLSQSPVACTGNATGSATVTVTGGTPTYTYNWSPYGGSGTTASGLTAGVYNVTVTDVNGCVKVQSVVITQPASALGSTITSQDNVGCTGSATGSAAVTGAGGTPTYTYNWNNGETTPSLTGLSAGTYTVVITDANGCTKEQTVSILQPAAALNASIASQTNVGCTGSTTGGATVTGTGGTPTYTYNWSPGGFTTAVVSGLTVGSYVVTLSDFYGCTATQTVAITQPASALSSITGNTNSTCGNSNGTVSVTAIGGTPTYTYNWSDGSTDATTIGLSAGTYTVTVTDANGCSSTATTTVTDANGPVASIQSQTDASCNGSASGTATISVSGGTPGYTYSWSPMGGTDATATGLTAGTYVCTVTDINGCTHSQSITVNEPTVLITGISSQTNVGCTGAATGNATVTGTGGTPTYTYSWNTGGTDASVAGLTAGTYTCTVTDANGCSQQQTVTITEPVFNLSSAINSQVNVGCNGGTTGNATVTGIGGTPTYSYSWLPSGGNGPTATGLTAGTYSVTVTDQNGCTTVQTVTITEPSLTLTSNITSQNNVSCNGGNNASVKINVSGGTPSYNYSWAPNVGSTDSLSGLTAGTYVCIITDANGCTQQQTVTITEAQKLNTVVSSQTNPKCNGDTTGTATISTTGGTPNFSYTWTPNIGNTSTVSGLGANTYTVLVTDALGCTTETIVTITQPAPFSLTTPAASTVCAGETITLTAFPNGGTGPVTLTWSPNGPVVAPTVPTTYYVFGTDSSGCISVTDSITITPLPAPTADFDTISSGFFGKKYNFTDLSSGATSWYWLFGDEKTSTSQNPFHVYPGAGTYTVTLIVTGPSGCTDTITKVITIYPDIIFPNVFTPNNDGINDEFWIPSSGFESFEIVIYNRWGMKLWESDSGEIRWDGRSSAGEEVPDGTYYFLLKAILKTEGDGIPYEHKGFIDIHRSY